MGNIHENSSKTLHLEHVYCRYRYGRRLIFAGFAHWRGFRVALVCVYVAFEAPRAIWHFGLSFVVHSLPAIKPSASPKKSYTQEPAKSGLSLQLSRSISHRLNERKEKKRKQSSLDTGYASSESYGFRLASPRVRSCPAHRPGLSVTALRCRLPQSLRIIGPSLCSAPADSNRDSKYCQNAHDSPIFLPCHCCHCVGVCIPVGPAAKINRA